MTAVPPPTARRNVRAGVEAGGTKFVCAVGTGPDDVLASTVVPTTTPGETLAGVAAFFDAQRDRGVVVDALGIASFGPLDLRPESPTYGRITTTPKHGWAGTDLLGALRDHLGVPAALDTDVNGAAYSEFLWGAARDVTSSVYLTVGTGVGGGAVVGGEAVGGHLHPEMGHLPVRRHPDDTFAGACPFHGDCLEGLASGPAIRARAGRPAEELTGAERERFLELEAWYLAQLVCSVAYLLAPHRVVIGGGVLQAPGLLEAVRTETVRRLTGALDGTPVADDVDRYLVRPALGSMSGVLGGIALAGRALESGSGAPPPRTGHHAPLATSVEPG